MSKKKLPLIPTFLNAFNGIGWILKNERNFQIEIAAFVFNIILIFYFKLVPIDIILIMLVCFIVMISEMLNTTIEKICDIVQPKWDKKIRIIKDVAAGAVVLSVLLALITGIYVYAPYVRFVWLAAKGN